MTHPIPPGTRDVLPEEMRELRAIGDRMRACFERAGYGEVHTPALEYEDVLRRGEERAAGARYRTFDESGAVLALRSDMTIPIARVVATRYADAEPPLRFSYLARAWRATDRGVGEPREFLQGGLELIGVPGAEGEAEVVALAIAALDEAGLRRHRVGVGDGALYRSLLTSFGVPEEAHLPMLESLSRRDLVGPRGPGERARSRRRPSATCSSGCRSSAAAARCSTGPTPPASTACGRCTSCSPSAGWPTA